LRDILRAVPGTVTTRRSSTFKHHIAQHLLYDVRHEGEVLAKLMNPVRKTMTAVAESAVILLV